MRRRVRFHSSFRDDLAARISWLRRNRPPDDRARLRAALTSFIERVAAHPQMGRELMRRGSRSFRAVPLGRGLPYLVWYVYDDAEPHGPVWLAMLLHEAQDRERFAPDPFD